MGKNKELVDELRYRLKTVWIVLRRAAKGQYLPRVFVDAALDDLKQGLGLLTDSEETAEIRNKLQRALTILEKLSSGQKVSKRMASAALADFEKAVGILIQIRALKKFLIILFFLLSTSTNSYPQTSFDISGIMYSSEPMAVVNGRIVREKDEVDGFIVEKIGENLVRFRNGQEVFTQGIRQGPPRASSSLPGKTEIEQPVIIKDVVKEEDIVEKSESSKDVPGFDHCLNAKENFDLAEENLGKKNFAKAFIYYKKAHQYAQWALAYRIEGKRDEMKSIVRVSDDQQRKLRKKSNVEEKITSTRYPKLKNAKEIMNWLKRNIKYQSDLKVHGQESYWQTPEETMVLRTGDCEDFAFLAQAMLKQIGVDSTVISVVFGSEFFDKTAHALCIFPSKNPKGVFSNYQLYTSTKNIMNYVQHEYSDWLSISVLDINPRKRVRILEKQFGGFKKVNERANAVMISDLLGEAEK
ncbi:MAG: transglutaminase-like domain-containing protein [Candidatus Omnitrophota bacterium]